MQRRKVNTVNSNSSPSKNSLLAKKLGGESPQRKRVENYYLNSGEPINTEANKYQDFSVSPVKKDEQALEAMKVLDAHITYLTKNCYYFLKNEVINRNNLIIGMLRDFNHHENVDLLVRNCQRYVNETDYQNNLAKQSRSKQPMDPYRPSSGRIDSEPQNYTQYEDIRKAQTSR